MAPLRTLFIVSAATMFACTGGYEEPERPVQPPAETPKAPEGQLDRAQLEVILRQGPSWLFQRVPIEEVMDNNKFVGWRVQEVPVEWKSVDLMAGDVVTSVNGMALETPNDFWTAWTSLSVASELKVAYLREGEPRELSIPIYGMPNPDVAGDMKKRAGTEKPKEEPVEESPVKANQDYAPPKRDKTITIKGDDPPDTGTMTDWSDQPDY